MNGDSCDSPPQMTRRKKRVEYKDFNFKQPQQSADYEECSAYVIEAINEIMGDAIEGGRNKIMINTNLKLGLPMENINKIAGPLVEAWAHETFHAVFEQKGNKFNLINVEAMPRLYMADVILQFERQRPQVGESGITAEVDVKATSQDIEDSGKSPNITSFARIRTAYVEDPDYIFLILSLKHRVYSKRNAETEMMDAIMEIVAHNTYDLKHLASEDISYNPALGTGQIQIKDIHYVTLSKRSTWEFCQLLDKKYLNSSKKNIAEWAALATKNGWIKQ